MSAPTVTKYAGSGWLRESRPYWKKAPNADRPISPFGEVVADMLGQIYGGIYHVPDDALAKVDWSAERSIGVVVSDSSLATWDFSDLTHLVLMGHDRCVRVAVHGIARGRVRLQFHLRSRDGGMAERHPTIEEAITEFRSRNGGPSV